MRVGIYVDGYNLYYGARGLCGRGTPGWRWLDLRALATDLVGRRTNWQGAYVERVVYCTARIDGADNPDGQRDQSVYLNALRVGRSVDHIEFGITSFGLSMHRWPYEIGWADPRSPAQRGQSRSWLLGRAGPGCELHGLLRLP